MAKLDVAGSNPVSPLQRFPPSFLYSARARAFCPYRNPSHSCCAGVCRAGISVQMIKTKSNKPQLTEASKCQSLVVAAPDPVQKLKDAMGTANLDLGMLRFNEALAVTSKTSTDESDSPVVKQTFAALTAIGPRDEIEGMLAVQMTALHNLAMKRVAQAMNDAPSVAQPAANQAVRAMHAFTNHLEVLSKYRGKGQQKVIVEHVHVHPGGQAIVGSIETQGQRQLGGGGPKDVS